MLNRAAVVPDFHSSLQALYSALRKARALTDGFFARLTPQAMYARSIAERHRVIFYLGHLEAFDWNLLGHRVFGQKAIQPELEQLFAFGIDPVDGQLPRDEPSDWPTISVVQSFCQQIRRHLDATIERWITTCTAPSRSIRDALEMALEHRLMHLETLSYKLPHLPLTSFVPDSFVPLSEQPGPNRPGYDRVGVPHQPRIVNIPAGPVTIGRNRDDYFGWDNEFCAQTVQVPAFAIAARNVTNGEFLSFVLDGGYQERTLWTDPDWQWKTSRNLALPILWSPRGKDYFARSLFEELPLPLDWPVTVSLAEARAYVRYLHAKDPHTTARLPSEAELHRAAYADAEAWTAQTQDAVAEAALRQFPWPGPEAVPLVHGNFGGIRHDPCPVGAFPEGDSPLGVADLYGNGWEWTQTPFRPLTDFQIDPRYPGYSQPFFDDKHFVIRGASATTDVRFLRRSFRNWFQAHYPYVFATFRCVYDHRAQSPS